MDTQPFLTSNEEHKNFQPSVSFTPSPPPSATPTYITLPNGQLQITLPAPPPLTHSHSSLPLSSHSSHSSSLPLSSPPPPPTHSNSQPAFPYSHPQQLYPPVPAPYPYQHQQYPNASVPAPSSSCCSPSSSSYKGVKIAMLITYITGFFFFFPHFVSVILSLHLLRRGQIVKRASAVIAFSVIEIIFWTACASMSWYFQYGCGDDSDDSGYYDSYECGDVYWGWVAIAVWGFFTLALGIPRIIISWIGDNNDHINNHHNSINNDDNNAKSESQPLILQQYNSPLRASLGLRVALLSSYFVGLISFVPHLLSIILSLILFRRGQAIKDSAWIVACSVIELVAWSACASLSWFYVQWCDDDDYDYEDCENVWVGWIAIIPWFVVALVFGIPRVVLSFRN